MYIAELLIENFRIFGEKEQALVLPLKPGLTALVGENDMGKTAVIDALRFALGTRDQEYFRIVESDFHRPLGDAKHRKAIRIRCKFDGLSLPDKAAFAEYLTFEDRDNVKIPVLYVNWKADEPEETLRRKRFASVVIRSGLCGDGPQLDPAARDLLCATYLRPLRDAERSMSAGRGSRLSEILENTPGIDRGNGYDSNSDAPQDHRKLSIVGISDLADDLLNRHEGVRRADERLNTDYLRHLSFSGSQLRGRIGVGGTERDEDIRLRQLLEKLDLQLHEGSSKSSPVKRGLGSNNLLFMACELLLLGDEQNGFPLLLIEEPEAHLHPQRQLRLMKFLQEKADEARHEREGMQIIVTTHSPNLASAIDLENLVLLQGGRAYSLAPGQTGMSRPDYAFLKRFLDVTKANMFFARGLLIVEGDAENILIPTLARLIGRDLAKNGVSIVNVGGTGLRRFARVYQRKNPTESIDVPVACVTDLDVMPDCAPEITGKVAKGEGWPNKRHWRARKDYSTEELKEHREGLRAKASGQCVETFVADQWTLEYDLAFSGLGEHVWIAANLAKSDEQINGKTTTLRSIVRKARRSYKALLGHNLGKDELASQIYAEFTTGSKVSKATAAQYLASLLETLQKNDRHRLSVTELREKLPPYLVSAIDHVTPKGEPSTEKKEEEVPNA